MVPVAYPNQPKDRFEVYRFFNGLAAEARDESDGRRTRTPIVKSFLLEHVAPRLGYPQPPANILRSLGAQVRPIDDTLIEVRWRDKNPNASDGIQRVVGYVEQYDQRFFAHYTCDDSKVAKPRVNHWITRSPDLDSTWFSSQLLQRLWDTDVSCRGDDRFGKLTFKHQSIFEMPDDAAEDLEVEDSGGSADSELDEDEPAFERRAASFHMTDRIGRIRASLQHLQSGYAPLYALYGLRFPSRGGSGSHDLYQEGRVTNRSGSFEEHRNLVRYLYRTYRAMLERTEEVAWHRLDQAPGSAAVNFGAQGVPLIVRFREELSAATFQRWVTSAFRKRNRFRLWGEPIWMGPTKVHVYGADRHLWQPISLEMTATGLVAILPQGTCGNTFHRLVTNVQAYVCPKVEAWLGDEKFQAVVDQSIQHSGGFGGED
jgi:hypothetical protein